MIISLLEFSHPCPRPDHASAMHETFALGNAKILVISHAHPEKMLSRLSHESCKQKRYPKRCGVLRTHGPCSTCSLNLNSSHDHARIRNHRVMDDKTLPLGFMTTKVATGAGPSQGKADSSSDFPKTLAPCRMQKVFYTPPLYLARVTATLLCAAGCGLCGIQWISPSSLGYSLSATSPQASAFKPSSRRPQISGSTHEPQAILSPRHHVLPVRHLCRDTVFLK